MTRPYVVGYLLVGPVLTLLGHWSVGQLWLPAWTGNMLPTLGFFPGLALTPYALAHVWVKAYRAKRPSGRTTWVGAVAVLMGLLLFFATVRVGMRLRIAGYGGLATHMAPVIDAIRRFEAASGRPPSTLAEVVPAFIAELPEGAERVEYVREGDPRCLELYGNPWMLFANAGWSLQFDSFVYFPNQAYPAHMFGGRPEPVGDWVYVHE